MNSIVERLSKLIKPVWFPNAPASEEALQRLEKDLDIKLPHDYRAVMLYSNGGMLLGENSGLTLEPVEELSAHNLDERFERYLPGMFVIGDDGGGSVYYYDPQNRLKHGNYDLFLVPLAEIGFLDSIHVGPSLTETINAILSGESFFDHPRLGGKTSQN